MCIGGVSVFCVVRLVCMMVVVSRDIVVWREQDCVFAQLMPLGLQLRMFYSWRIVTVAVLVHLLAYVCMLSGAPCCLSIWGDEVDQQLTTMCTFRANGLDYRFNEVSLHPRCRLIT